MNTLDTIPEDLTPEQIAAALVEMGFMLESTSASPQVRDNDWPCLTFGVTLKFKDRIILTEQYSVGLGNVKVTPAQLKALGSHKDYSVMLTGEEQNCAAVLACRSYAKFHDPMLHLSLMSKLANSKKFFYRPSLDSVMHSFLSDGSTFFDAYRFEDWAADFGYSADSIKAKETFDHCDRIGRALTRALGGDMIDRLRQMFQNY